jgi:hypothetical protein
MRDIDSKQAYCVSLSGETLEGSSMTWIDVVKIHRTYFYSAVGGGWPKTPPNYMAFRYQGRLQAIHHVDSYEIGTNLPKTLSLPPRKRCPGSSYRLDLRFYLRRSSRMALPFCEARAFGRT